MTHLYIFYKAADLTGIGQSLVTNISYSGRKADVTGVVHSEATGWVMKGLDGNTFPILSYANGPGFMRFQVNSLIFDDFFMLLNKIVFLPAYMYFIFNLYAF